LEWLKTSLKTSRATWKVISTDTPLSIVTGSVGDHDAWAQNNPAVLGREGELRELLKFIKDNGIRNLVWLTADVHFPAAIFYDAAQASFRDFEPFWEFVIGPTHAGAFGPADNLPLDTSFGARYDFKISPPAANLPPPHNQFFGSAEIDAAGRFIARIHDTRGQVVYQRALTPA
jgi:alkaline phosphatase D